MQQPLSLSETGSLVAVVWTGTKRLIWHRQQIGGRPSGILILAPEPRREPSTTEAGTDWIVGLPGKAAGESELIRHSLLGLVSLRPALPALYDLFPALQEIGRFTTPTIAPDDLGRRIAGLAQPVLLIVDTPGAERDVLEAFEAAQGLERIGIIRLRCGAEPFFEGAWSCEEALAWLSARHFRVIARNDVDPEWPEITLEVDFQGRRIASLEDAFAQRDAALTETRKGLAGLQAEVEALRGEVAGRTARLTEVEGALAQREADLGGARDALAQRDAALTETRKGLAGLQAEVEALRGEVAGRTARLTEVEAALAQREADLGGARDALAQRDAALTETRKGLAGLQAEVAGRTARLTEVEAALAQREAELGGARDALAQRDAALTETRKGLAGLQAEAEALRGEVASRTARLTEVEAALAQRDATLTETRKGLDDCKADLSVTLRMQMLTQADLRDLQERYREADRQRQAQADLLQKLAPRLQMVRHQLTQVMDPPPLELPNGRIIISTSHKKKKRNAGSKAERKS